MYSLTFLGSENSYREKDTWDSPRCLIAIHEGEDGGCVYGKLKKTNSADNAEVHLYKRPAEGLKHLHDLGHGRQ
jgi:hypothetical protein